MSLEAPEADSSEICEFCGFPIDESGPRRREVFGVTLPGTESGYRGVVLMSVEAHQVLVEIGGPVAAVVAFPPYLEHETVSRAIDELDLELHHALDVGPGLVADALQEEELVTDGGSSDLGNLTVASVLN